MTPIIDRLMDSEYAYGEPEYSNLAKSASCIQQKLSLTLNPQENALLQQLIDVYTAQYMPIIHDAFRDGFCKAITLLNEVQYCKFKEEKPRIHT